MDPISQSISNRMVLSSANKGFESDLLLE